MAGMKVKIISCDSNGNINLNELKEKSEIYSNNLSAIMLTYPSTHGVFESDIEEACEIVHKNGGQVYIDGANLNAIVGYVNLVSLGVMLCILTCTKHFAFLMVEEVLEWVQLYVNPI